ncbi:choice-of-anchor Q domain-containing protein [Dokdonella fugitiva]|nr:choice-of-anchor Q domain-containing protein [Dokdonella fugitiva]
MHFHLAMSGRRGCCSGVTASETTAVLQRRTATAMCHRVPAMAVCALACATASMPATAATFCVASESMAQQALDAAATNGEIDVIYFHAGTYPLVNGLHFSTQVAGDHKKVIVRGGYNPSCDTRIGYTVLDGQNLIRPLLIHLQGPDELHLEYLVFEHGTVGAASTFGPNGGGMYVQASVDAQSRLVLDSLRFLANAADGGSGGGLVVAGGVSLELRNSLFRSNTAQDGHAAGMVLYGDAHIVNNTVSGNAGLPPEPQAAFFITMAQGHTAWLGNNIFWGNPGAAHDLRLEVFGDGAFQLVANDIGTRGGVEPVEVGDTNLDNVDPQFDMQDTGFFDLPLGPASPLIDAGESAPAGGLPAFDLLGALRVNGQGVDLGAYELDRLFANGFDGLPVE